jgi:hypothetical protein
MNLSGARIMAIAWILTGGFVLLWGFIRNDRRNRIEMAGLFVLGILVQGPTLLMPHVTEGNLNRTLPFWMILSCLAFVPVWKSAASILKKSLLILLAVWLTFSIFSIERKVEDIIEFRRKAVSFRMEVKRLMPSPPQRAVVFVAEETPKGYSRYRQPLWLALQAEVEIGLKHMYGNPSYQGRLYLTESFKSLPDSLKSADFFVDRFERLSATLPQPEGE